jgi:hypothetical protein
MSHTYWWLFRATPRVFPGTTFSRNSANVPDQWLARCCWANAWRFLTNSLWRSDWWESAGIVLPPATVVWASQQWTWRQIHGSVAARQQLARIPFAVHVTISPVSLL